MYLSYLCVDVSIWQLLCTAVCCIRLYGVREKLLPQQTDLILERLLIALSADAHLAREPFCLCFCQDWFGGIQKGPPPAMVFTRQPSSSQARRGLWHNGPWGKAGRSPAFLTYSTFAIMSEGEDISPIWGPIFVALLRRPWTSLVMKDSTQHLGSSIFSVSPECISPSFDPLTVKPDLQRVFSRIALG